MIIYPSRVAAALPAYELGAELGSGGFGTVLAGRHRSLDRDVAVKVLASSSAGARSSFAAEARILASIDHPHIVRVYDFVENHDLLVIIMELLAGGTLTSRQAWLTGEDSCAVGLAVADALSHAHARGVLHRDVKPDNILFDADGIVKVTDFGVAKVLTGAAVHASAVVGTPNYMAPEQITGSRLSPATDVYGLGVVLYELLARRSPFDPNLPFHALYYQVLNAEPAPLDDVPPPLRDVVARALTKDPRHRYPSAYDFALDLADAATRCYGVGWTGRSTIMLKLSEQVQVAATQSSPPWQHPADGYPARLPRSTRQSTQHEPAGRPPTTRQTPGYQPTARHPTVVQRRPGPRRLDGLGRLDRARRPDGARPPDGTPRQDEVQRSGRAARRHSVTSYDSGRRQRRRRLTATGIVAPLALAATVAAYFALDDGGARDAAATEQMATPTTVTPSPTPEPLVVTPTSLATVTAHGTVLTTAFSPDGTVLATGDAESDVMLWDVSVPSRPKLIASIDSRSRQHPNDDVLALAFSPDGATLASGSADDKIMIWDVSAPDQPDLVATLDDHTADVQALAFSPDSELLASGGDDADLLIWDVGNVHRPRPLASVDARSDDHHTDDVTALAFSPDGATLASGGADADVLLWDVTTPSRPMLAASLDEHSDAVLGLVFSPDGELLVSSGADAAVLLTDVADIARPTLTADLRDHVDGGVSGGDGESGDGGDAVRSVALSPDGRALAAGTSEGVVEIWDVTTGDRPRLAATLDESDKVRAPVAFSPGGQVLATGGKDKTAHLWRLR